MRRGVSAKQVLSVYVVVIILRSTNVIFWNKQTIKVLFHRDNWRQIIHHCKHGAAPTSSVVRINMFLDSFS